jgi:SanA protein
LGTAKYYSTGINPFYEARMNATAQLYHSGLVEQVIASGDHSTPFYNEPGMMLEDLVLLGVPEQVILRDGGGIRTLQSVRRLETEFGQTDVIIVSQQFHLERALYLAQAAGISAQGFVADDPPFHWYWRVRLREVFARLSALMDVHLLERR